MRLLPVTCIVKSMSVSVGEGQGDTGFASTAPYFAAYVKSLLAVTDMTVHKSYTDFVKGAENVDVALANMESLKANMLQDVHDAQK